MIRTTIGVNVGILVLCLGIWFAMRPSYKRQTGGGPEVSLLCATRSIVPGTVLSASELRTCTLPESYVEEGYTREEQRNAVLGQAVLVYVHAGDVLRSADLGDRQVRAVCAARLLPQGTQLSPEDVVPCDPPADHRQRRSIFQPSLSFAQGHRLLVSVDRGAPLSWNDLQR